MAASATPPAGFNNAGSSATLGTFITQGATKAASLFRGVKVPNLSDRNTAAKIEKNMFNILLGLGATYCLGSKKLAMIVGAGLYGAVVVKNDEIRAKIKDFTASRMVLGEYEFGFLNLFIPHEGASDEHILKTRSNAMMALMITYVVNPWLGANITAAFFGFQVAKTLHNLSQANQADSSSGGEV